jgi:hypothetical protein
MCQGEEGREQATPATKTCRWGPGGEQGSEGAREREQRGKQDGNSVLCVLRITWVARKLLYLLQRNQPALITEGEQWEIHSWILLFGSERFN